MKVFMRSVLLLGFIAITTQDITGRKGCDCSVCKGVDNKINPIVGKKIGDGGGGKSSCNICEHRKEMLRLEREKQRQLQKCPFEILGAPALKGKTSEEIFDEFRELVVPSQNGFFDMMRGIVRTMHVSSEAELKWAKEKEARELAKKRKEEEARKREELKSRRDEIVNSYNPVIYPPRGHFLIFDQPADSENVSSGPELKLAKEKQEEAKSRKEEAAAPYDPLIHTPPDQAIIFGEPMNSQIIPMIKRITKGASEQETLNLLNDQTPKDYVDISSKDNLFPSNAIEQLLAYNTWTSTPSQNEVTETTEGPEEDLYTSEYGSSVAESSTESPFVKFVSHEEMKALYGRKNSADDFGFDLYPTDTGYELQGVRKENIDYSVAPHLV